MRTSLVVPCYQEEDALEAFGVLLPGLVADEVVFVDDGSTDGTPGRLAGLAAVHPRVRVVTHPANRGVGAAMRTGLAAATGDVVVVYDADRTYPPEDVARLVAAVGEGADVATASPFAPEGDAGEVPFLRRLLSHGAAFAWRLVIGPRGRDVHTFTCAFRAYRHAAISGLRFQSDGFPAAAEILARLLLRGARVVEVPSRLGTRKEGRSKMRVLRAIAGHGAALAAVARARARGRTPS